jgi:hypothetical protein
MTGTELLFLSLPAALGLGKLAALILATVAAVTAVMARPQPLPAPARRG